jgi:hypothetical protein
MEPGIDALEGEIALVEGTRARLRLVAVRHLRAMAQTPRLHRVVYQELRWSNYYGSPLHRLNQRYTRIVLWIIEEGMRAGELRADTDPQVVRDMFYGGLEHVGWRTVLAHRAVDVESSAVAVADLVFASVASPPSEAAPDRLDRIAGRLESAVAALGPVLVSPASRGA